MKKLRFLLAFILGGLLILVLFVMVSLVWKVRQYKAEKADYTRYTSPLSSDTVKDICLKLALSDQDDRCRAGAVVYAPEFFDDVKEHFRSMPKEIATQEEVDKILGEYKMRCSQPTKLSTGKIYYRCLYDLHGDEVSIISVYFHGDGTIDYIMASTGGS